jgi:hypothetical protein
MSIQNTLCIAVFCLLSGLSGGTQAASLGDDCRRLAPAPQTQPVSIVTDRAMLGAFYAKYTLDTTFTAYLSGIS